MSNGVNWRERFICRMNYGTEDVTPEQLADVRACLAKFDEDVVRPGLTFVRGGIGGGIVGERVLGVPRSSGREQGET